MSTNSKTDRHYHLFALSRLQPRTTRSTALCLVVHDFGVKYVGKADF
jgi:hypothetical protein